MQFFKIIATVSFIFNGSNASLNNKVNTIYDNSTSLTASVINKDNIINCDYTYGSDGKILHTITSEYFDCENYSYRGSNSNNVSYASLGGKTSLVVQIKENWFATSIVVSYIKDNIRYITYANNLNSNGSLTTYYNSIGV